MTKTVQAVLSVVILITTLGYFAYFSFVQISTPSLTQMEVFLETWQGLLPTVFLGIVLAILRLIEYWKSRV